jgi:hypothetical protein
VTHCTIVLRKMISMSESMAVAVAKGANWFPSHCGRPLVTHREQRTGACAYCMATAVGREAGNPLAPFATEDEATRALAATVAPLDD